jgi:hypothetical protein
LLGVSKKTKVMAAALLSLVVVIAVAGIVWHFTRPQPVEGEKGIEVTIAAHGFANTYLYRTDALFLRQALEEHHLIAIAGDESAFGLFVKTVGGYTVNEENMEWWSFAVNGEDLMVGVDEAAIHDGDRVTITLMIGW